jgi:hypothetical protein
MRWREIALEEEEEEEEKKNLDLNHQKSIINVNGIGGRKSSDDWGRKKRERANEY